MSRCVVVVVVVVVVILSMGLYHCHMSDSY